MDAFKRRLELVSTSGSRFVRGQLLNSTPARDDSNPKTNASLLENSDAPKTAIPQNAERTTANPELVRPAVRRVWAPVCQVY